MGSRSPNLDSTLGAIDWLSSLQPPPSTSWTTVFISLLLLRLDGWCGAQWHFQSICPTKKCKTFSMCCWVTGRVLYRDCMVVKVPKMWGVGICWMMFLLTSFGFAMLDHVVRVSQSLSPWARWFPQWRLAEGTFHHALLRTLEVGYYCFVLSLILLALFILCVFYTMHRHLTHLPSSQTHSSASATRSPNKTKLQRKRGEWRRIGKSPVEASVWHSEPWGKPLICTSLHAGVHRKGSLVRFKAPGLC